MSPEQVKPTVDDIDQPDSQPTRDTRARQEQTKTFSLPHLKKERYRQETERLRREESLRTLVAGIVFFIVFAWLACVVVILCWRGIGEDRLSDNVLIALLTTTTINVIGLLYTVVRYLFPRPSPRYRSSQRSRKPQATD